MTDHISSPSGLKTFSEFVRIKFHCGSDLLRQVKIWFQNHRYKTKKQKTDGSGGELVMESLGHHIASPRRVPVPVLVRDGRPVLGGSSVSGTQTFQGSTVNTSLGSGGNAHVTTMGSHSHNPSSYPHFLEYYQQHQQSQASGQGRGAGLQHHSSLTSHSSYSGLQSSYNQTFQGASQTFQGASCHSNALMHSTPNSGSGLGFAADQPDSSAFSHMLGQSFYPPGGFSFTGGQTS